MSPIKNRVGGSIKTINDTFDVRINGFLISKVYKFYESNFLAVFKNTSNHLRLKFLVQMKSIKVFGLSSSFR